MNPHNYNIVVSRKEIEGEWLYEGKVLEFPDVCIYESNFQTTYEEISLVIEDLIDLAQEMNHEVPEPVKKEDIFYSGKMTFRPGKWLHKNIAEAAERDGQSQNQFLCSIVAAGLVRHEYSGEFKELTKSINSLVRNYVSTNVIAGRLTGVNEVFIEKAEVTAQPQVFYFGAQEDGFISTQNIAVPEELLYSQHR